MEEKALKKSDSQSFFSKLRVRVPARAPGLNQKGQSLVEYALVLLISITFTFQVFFNPKFGFKGIMQTTMLRLGSFLEQNLKSGTQVGGDGKKSLEPFAGTNRWNN